MIRIKYLLLSSGDAKTTHFTITKISEAILYAHQCTHISMHARTRRLEWSLSLPMRTHIPLSTLSDRHHEGETSISRILRQTRSPKRLFGGTHSIAQWPAPTHPRACARLQMTHTHKTFVLPTSRPTGDEDDGHGPPL